jgi:hypothetical protein
VYQRTITSSPTLKMSKPLPERVESHHRPCVNGERSATVAAFAKRVVKARKIAARKRFMAVNRTARVVSF